MGYDVQKVAQAIGVPVEQWPGNCYSIALAMVKAGVIAGGVGRPQYGHWLGPVAPGTYFAVRASRLPFIPHGWVEHPFDMVTDPTRWVFEGVPPYIYWGKRGPEYDPGGNGLRRAMMQPCPPYDETARRVVLSFGDPGVRSAVMTMLGWPPFVTVDHCFWLANLPLDELGGLAGAVFESLVEAGQSALIPLDNLGLVLAS